MTYELIHKRLNKFRKRYYFFISLKGLLTTFFIVLTLSLFAVVLNYFFYLSPSFKSILFWSDIFLAIVLFILLFLYPFFRFIGILPNFDDLYTSRLISSYFPQISDLLINIVELKSTEDSSIVKASILQKYSKIKHIDFLKFFSFKQLRLYLFIAFFPILISLILNTFNKPLLKQGITRFVNYSVYYSPPDPYILVIHNKELSVFSGSDFKLTFSFKGKFKPQNVFIRTSSGLKLPVVYNPKNDTYSYLFKSVTSPIQFKIIYSEFTSNDFIINVKFKPFLSSVSILIKPPAYTNLDNFIVTNPTDLAVPYGSVVKFTFKGNYDSLFLILNDMNIKTIANHISFKVYKSSPYSLILKNSVFTDTMFTFNLNVLPDLFPTIKISYVQDSSNFSIYYYKGNITDDYGFHSLSFVYSSDSSFTNKKVLPLKFYPSVLSQEFYLTVNFDSLSSNSPVYYYFVVQDNDLINSFKTVKSNVFIYKPFDLTKIESVINVIDSSNAEQFNQIDNFNFDFSKSLQHFLENSLNDNVTDWNKKSSIQNLIEFQKNLLNSYKKISLNNRRTLNLLKSTSIDSSLLHQYEDLQKLINQMINEYIKSFLNQLNELQKNPDDKNLEKKLSKLSHDYQKLLKKNDILKNLMQQLQLTKDLMLNANRFKDLSNKISKLSDKNIKINNSILDSLSNFENKFKKLKVDYDSLLKQNKRLEKPYNLDSLSDAFNKAIEDFKQSKSSNSNKKFKKSIKQLANDISNIATSISSSLMTSMNSQKGEDAQLLKQLFTDLIELSYKQEKLYFSTLTNLNVSSRRTLHFIHSQQSIGSNFSIVRDSLVSISKRNSQVAVVILPVLDKIDDNIERINNYLSNANFKISVYQRDVLSELNYLALILQESIKNSQNSSSFAPGNKNSSTDGKPKPIDLKNIQQQLQKMLEQMIQNKAKGQQPSDKELGKILSKMEELQQMLQKQLNEKNLSPQQRTQLNNAFKLNEQNIKDLLNGKINSQLIERNERIKSRLLDSEKADRKQKIDKKRISQTANDINHNPNDSIKKYFKYETREYNQFLEQNSLLLNRYFKKIYNEYVVTEKK